MEEIIRTINAVIGTLDNIHIKGRITENAQAYNEIISCINTLAQVNAKLQERNEPVEENEIKDEE